VLQATQWRLTAKRSGQAVSYDSFISGYVGSYVGCVKTRRS